MPSYADLYKHSGTPQSQPILNNPAPQAKNSAGGFTFILSPFQRLERFLILGSDGPTYYASAPELTKENAACVTTCWTEDEQKTAAIISEISLFGRAAKNSAAIFALALGVIHPKVKARQCAYAQVNTVCRTSTHLFEFYSTCKALGKGDGRGLKNSLARWYEEKTDDELAYQLIKYRQRDGLTHRDMLRIAHPKAQTQARKALFDWTCGRGDLAYNYGLPELVKAHIQAMVTEEKEHIDGSRSLTRLLDFHPSLPWEALPTWANTKPEIWQKMLPNMGLTALVRNLGNMTRLGVFNDQRSLDIALRRITNPEEIRRARLHPFNLLVALKTYDNGHGFRNAQRIWVPISDLSNALEHAFHISFSTSLSPSNKRVLLALDVSGSMNSRMGETPLTVREASSAMALVSLNSEEVAGVVGFTSLHNHNSSMGAISKLDIKRGDTLQKVCRYTDGLPFSGTDCSLPMLYAIENHMDVDAFVIYTDNETWAGRIQPVEALKKYRSTMNKPNAKLVVVGMTSIASSIGDPNDPNILDVVGFDSNAPAIIANFIRVEQSSFEGNDDE